MVKENKMSEETEEIYLDDDSDFNVNDYKSKRLDEKIPFDLHNEIVIDIRMFGDLGYQLNNGKGYQKLIGQWARFKNLPEDLELNGLVGMIVGDDHGRII